MGVSKVELYYDHQEDDPGIRVRVNDNTATLGDLLEAWQPLCDDESLYKAYAEGQHRSCRGCTSNCCNTAYVIPDLIAFKKMAGAAGLDYDRFIARYFQPDKLKAGLLRMQPNPCIFLRDNLCTVYPIRSLICRFYICCQLAGDTQQLIYGLSWIGSASAQIFAERAGLLSASTPTGLTSFDLMFKKMLEEFRADPRIELFMQAEEYGDIPLASFL